MKLKKLTVYCLALFCASSSLYAQSGEEVQKKRSGNPIFPGWYADPEGVVLDGKFWIYPTYSAPYVNKKSDKCRFCPQGIGGTFSRNSLWLFLQPKYQLAPYAVSRQPGSWCSSRRR